MIGRALILALLLGACSGKDARRSAAVAADTVQPAPGGRIDSVLPMAEYLRRFRHGLTEPMRLEGGTTTREALARQFLAAVAVQDSGAMRRLLLSPAEFAWLVFPQHAYSAPPSELDPAVFWQRLGEESDEGLRATLRRFGSHTLGFRELRCQRDTVQLRPGPASLWSSCRMTYRNGSKVETHRLFGSIVERDGRFKLLSLANEF